MAELKKDWPIGEGQFTVTYDGEPGAKNISVSSELNEGIDREAEISFDLQGMDPVKAKITQDGLRIEFAGSDEQFRTQDDKIFAALK